MTFWEHGQSATAAQPPARCPARPRRCTRRERLMATLRGEPVDRPAVSFYEIGGFHTDPADPDPFNIYNSPDWQPLLRLAEEETDLIRMRGPRLRAVVKDSFTATEEFVKEGSRFWRTTVRVGGRTLTSLTRRDPGVATVWTLEHLLKDADDVRAYLQLPDEVLAREVDVTPLRREDERLGDRGIVMVDTADPMCCAAALFSMEDYVVAAFAEPALFHQLLEKFARALHRQTEVAAREFPGHLWRIYGPEYASEPYLPPALFEEYVVRYTGPMVRAIQAHGGFARIHCHGRLKGILDLIVGMGADALDPIEPPPQGDVDLRYVRERYGDRLVLFGNIEVNDIELLPPNQFEEKVRRALDEGTAGQGRGFVLTPSASPYGRTLSSQVMSNYETMVRLVEVEQ